MKLNLWYIVRIAEEDTYELISGPWTFDEACRHKYAMQDRYLYDIVQQVIDVE